MNYTTIVPALLFLSLSVHAENVVNFERAKGYSAASSFIIPGEPGAVDGWFVLSGQLPNGKLIFGDNGARITPDPILTVLSGSKTLTVLEGLQSAAVTTNGALLARRFDSETSVSGTMKLSYRVITSTALLGLGGPKKVAAEFRYSDDLISSSATFPAGVRLSTLAPEAEGSLGVIEVLTTNQTWINTGAKFLYNHSYIVEIQLNGASNQYTVSIIDTTEPTEPRATIGTFEANGTISLDADRIRSHGGVALASQGNTVVFDAVNIEP